MKTITKHITCNATIINCLVSFSNFLDYSDTYSNLMSLFSKVLSFFLKRYVTYINTKGLTTFQPSRRFLPPSQTIIL